MPIMTMLVSRRSTCEVGPFAERVARHHDLADDLVRRQVAHQLLRAGVAEAAGQRAADLARDAERAAVGLGDVDGLDLLRIGKPEQPFARPVDRQVRFARHRPGNAEAPVEVRPERLRQVGHGVESGDAAVVDPLEYLPRTVGRDAERCQRGGHVGPIHADQVRARIRRRGSGLQGAAGHEIAKLWDGLAHQTDDIGREPAAANAFPVSRRMRTGPGKTSYLTLQALPIVSKALEKPVSE